MEQFCSLIHGPLEGLPPGNHSRTTSPLVDDGGSDGFFEVMGAGGTARVNETGAAHVAVDDLVTAKIDRVIGGELRVDALVELSVAGGASVEGLVATVVLGELLLDDVGLNGDAEVIGLTSEVGGEVVVLVFLEGVVAEVTPEDGGHSKLMGMMKGLGNLDDLVAGIFTAKVDGRPDSGGTHVIGLVNRAEHDLAGDIGVGEEFVVIHLHEKGDVVGILAGHRAEDAEGRGNSVAAALNGQFHDVLRIKVEGVPGEAGSCGVLDALIDRQDREVSSIGQSSGAVESLEIGKNTGIAVADHVDAIDKIRARKVQEVFGDGLAGVVEQGVSLRAEGFLDFGEHDESLIGGKKKERPEESSGRPLFKGYEKNNLVGSLGSLDVLFLDPGHAGAELLTNLFDGVLLSGLEQSIVLFLARLGLGNPILGKLAGLNVFQGTLHPLLDGGVDHFGSHDDVTVLGSLGDGEAHATDS